MEKKPSYIYSTCTQKFISCHGFGVTPQAVPLTLEDHYTLHCVFWVTNVLMWIFFVWCKFSNPGYVKINTHAYEKAVKMVSHIRHATAVRVLMQFALTSNKKHFMKNVKECRDVIVKKKYWNKVGTLVLLTIVQKGILCCLDLFVDNPHT